MAQMIGFGAKITLPDGSGGAQAAFGESVTVMFPSVKVGKAESTPLTPAESGDYFRKYLPTLKEAGQVTVEYHYNEADYLRVHALVPTPGTADKVFKVTDPSASSPLVGTITGFVEEVGEAMFTREGVVMNTFKLHVNKFATGDS